MKITNQKSGMARLMELAATKKTLVICSGILVALASIVSFVPYTAIYYIIGEIIGVYPPITSLDVQRTLGFGWIALGGILGNILLFTCDVDTSEGIWYPMGVLWNFLN